jgi:hypothetical protein
MTQMQDIAYELLREGELEKESREQIILGKYYANELYETINTLSLAVESPSLDEMADKDYERMCRDDFFSKLFKKKANFELMHAWHRNEQAPISTPKAFVPPSHLVKDHQTWLRSLVFPGDDSVFPYKSITESSEWYPVEEVNSDSFQYTRTEQRELLALLRDERQRYLTYTDWEPGGCTLGGILSTEGFFYFNQKCDIQCVFCLIILKDTKDIQEVVNLHKYFSPRCSIVKHEAILFGNAINKDSFESTFQRIIEPLHNPSLRKHPSLLKQIPSAVQISGINPNDSLSSGAFSSFPPLVFSDPYSLLELQQRALTGGGEIEVYTDIIRDINHLPLDECDIEAEISPETVAASQLSDKLQHIFAIPDKINNAVYRSLNTLETLTSSAELGWEPWFGAVFWAKEQGSDKNVARLRTSASNNKSEFLRIDDDNVLYQLTPDGKWKVIVPEHLWRYVTGAFHDTPIMGHYGPEKTLQRMKEYVYFYHMHTYVTDYIKSCVICQLYKKNRGRVQYQCTNVPPNIFHTMSMDLCGPYPKSSDGYMYIMVVQCVLTRYLFVIPLKTKTADEIAAKLVDNVFLRVGPPMRLLSDNAAEFHSALLKRLSDTFGYHRNFIQTYRPQQNGANERSHAELTRWLKMYMYEAETTKQWSVFKDLLSYAFNTTPHSTLGGRTPFEIVYGKKPPLKPFGWPEHSKPSNADFLKFFHYREEEIQRLRQSTRKVIEFNMKTSLDRANQKLKVPEFLLGDEVLEVEHRLLPKMIAVKKDWKPVYQPRILKVTEILSDAHVRIRDETGEERILHVDKLKRFNRRDGCVGFSHLPPRPLLDEDKFDDSDDEDLPKTSEEGMRQGVQSLLEARQETETLENPENRPTSEYPDHIVFQPVIQEPPAAEGLANVAEVPKQEWRDRLWGSRPKRNPKPTDFGSDYLVKRPAIYSYLRKK